MNDVEQANLRNDIVQALKILVGEGLFEKAYGHISARVPGEDLCLITGHIHGLEKTLDDLSADDVLLIDMDGNVKEGDLEPPGEFPIHTEIYRKREDVNSVVHCHPRAPVTLSIAGQDVLPVSFRGTIFSPSVPTFVDPTQIDDREKGSALADCLGSNRAVVLRGHGVACTGSSVMEAAVTTLDLEDVAQFQLDASALGEPQVVGDEYMRSGVIAGLEDEFFTSAWNYFVAKYRKKAAS